MMIACSSKLAHEMYTLRTMLIEIDGLNKFEIKLLLDGLKNNVAN